MNIFFVTNSIFQHSFLTAFLTPSRSYVLYSLLSTRLISYNEIKLTRPLSLNINNTHNLGNLASRHYAARSSSIRPQCWPPRRTLSPGKGKSLRHWRHLARFVGRPTVSALRSWLIASVAQAQRVLEYYV